MPVTVSAQAEIRAWLYGITAYPGPVMAVSAFLKESARPCASVQCLGRSRMTFWPRVVGLCVTSLQGVLFQ